MLASRCYITSASQHTSVINSHHLRYSRLWNNVHQVSSLTLCTVLTWADMWHRKSSQIPCHHKSLSSPLCLCLRLPLTVSLTSQPLPTPFHFSVWLQYFLVLEFFGVYFIFCSVASFTATAKLWLLCLLYELEKSASRSPASAAVRLILSWYACRSWVWTEG